MGDLPNRGDQHVRLRDENGNAAGITNDGKVKVETTSSSTSTQIVKIKGDTTGNIAEVTASGEVKVVSPPPAPPANTDPVNQVASSLVTSVAGVDTIYTITNSKTLTIQRLSGGAESSNSGSIIELYEDPNGDKSVMNLIDAIFVNGSSAQKDLNITYTGDGTRRIILRRRNFGGGSYEMVCRWAGYEE
ncbi:MAG: hypothetical protein GY817_01210 [bacterium]|nr:hypothetical protein [bacterium]